MNTNLNDTTPTAPSGKVNVTWQKDGSGNVSASVPAGSTGTVTNTSGALTANLPVLGNGSVDVKIGAAAQLVPTLPADATKYLDGTGAFSTPAGSGSAGALILLEQHTASSSATLDFTTGITATYDEYLIELVNVIAATNSVDFLMRMSTNGGSTYDSGANYSSKGFVMGGGSGLDGGTGQTSIWLTYQGTAHVSNNSSWGIVGFIKLYSPGSASLFKQVVGEVRYFTAEPARALFLASGAYESATAVNAIRFLFSSGNIASGVIRVYGIAK